MNGTRTGEHAMVVGASLAGLLAARVLAEAYDRVTVVDRDAMPEIGTARRGVPHGRHIHVLHARGQQVLEQLFPGFTTRLLMQGAAIGDGLNDFRIQLAGCQLRQAKLGLPMVMCSRPFLEGHLLARVSALPNVTLLAPTDVAGLTATPDRRRVTGVWLNTANTAREVPADLVIDATGRGSRAPRWLAHLGYRPPVQDRVDIGIGYATRTYRLRPGALGPDLGIMTGATPQTPRGGGLIALEGGNHMVTIFGILGDHPPTDPAGFDAFAASLAFPDIAEAIRGATPLTDPIPFRFPASVRHRYERLPRFPAGLLVLGDGVCSFNPVYGQGMTVAAMQADALRRLLMRGAVPTPRRYFREIARTVDPPWDLAVGADLAFPDVPGKRTVRIRVVNSYLPKLLAAAGTDATLGRAFIRVMGMVDRPATLLRPDRVLRVLCAPAAQRPGIPAHPGCHPPSSPLMPYRGG